MIIHRNNTCGNFIPNITVLKSDGLIFFQLIYISRNNGAGIGKYA